MIGHDRHRLGGVRRAGRQCQPGHQRQRRHDRERGRLQTKAHENPPFLDPQAWLRGLFAPSGTLAPFPTAPQPPRAVKILKSPSGHVVSPPPADAATPGGLAVVAWSGRCPGPMSSPLVGSLPMAKTYWVETLGCPKNQVDSDKSTGTMLADGLVPPSVRTRPTSSWSTPALSSRKPARNRSTPCWR